MDDLIIRKLPNKDNQDSRARHRDADSLEPGTKATHTVCRGYKPALWLPFWSIRAWPIAHMDPVSGSMLPPSTST
jgi:hypothetical protein